MKHVMQQGETVGGKKLVVKSLNVSSVTTGMPPSVSRVYFYCVRGLLIHWNDALRRSRAVAAMADPRIESATQSG